MVEREGAFLRLRRVDQILLCNLRAALVGQRVAVLVELVALHDFHVVVQLEGGLFEQGLLRELVLLVAGTLGAEVDADALDVLVGAVVGDGSGCRALDARRGAEGLLSPVVDVCPRH